MNQKKIWPKFVAWNRKMHLWVGLWGALLGLIFGVSGIWLNHRAVLKFPPVHQVRGAMTVALPDSAVVSPQDLASWVQSELMLKAGPNNTRVEKSKPVPWAGQGAQEDQSKKSEKQEAIRQPEKWTMSFGGPNQLVQVEYWVGNKTITINRTTNGLLATIMNLHKGTGMTAPWILLIDTFAGSIIFLSLSGVLIWSSQSKRRVQGIGIISVALLVALWSISARLS